ncbi:MAG: VWA domain-containing protein [Acidobacteriota bacterium]
MTFLSFPAWLAWSLLVAAMAAAVGSFLIPPRRITHHVASLLPWRTVLDAPKAASWWARIRRAVSLVLTAAIAAAIALALSKPVAHSNGSTQGRLVIVLDSSWSMGARTPSGRTRWALAVERARTMIAAADGREIAIATTAEGVVAGPTRDTARVTLALDQLMPSGGSDGAWPRVAGARDVHFLTDGAVPRATDVGVVVDSVFTPATNVAVTAFDVQPITPSQDRAEAYLAVTNFAGAAQAVRMTVTRAADVLVTRVVQIGAGETFRDVIPVVSAGDARFRLHISAGENALDIDDDAVSWLWSAQPLRVGIVGEGSLLPGLLAHDASLGVSIVDASAYATAAADVWVFDRWLPPAPPTAALVIEPPGSSWIGKVARQEANPSWQPERTHEILDGVDTEFVRLQKAVAFDRPALRPIARSREGTPLVSVDDGAAGRLVVIGFSTADSNIGSTSAFPILIANAIDWLGRPERGVHRSMGPVALPAATSSVTAPTGQSVPVSRSGNSITARLNAPGLYRIDTGGSSRVMTVALDDPLRSNLQVSGVPPAMTAAQVESARLPPWWTIAAWSALALAAIEWVTWLRRVTV